MPAPNLLARDFTTAERDPVWVGDSTSVPTWEGWLYLIVLLDACSRRVDGWAMADYLRTELALDALHLALSTRQPVPGFMHPIDPAPFSAARRHSSRFSPFAGSCP